MLKLLGWKIDYPVPMDQKCIILAAPHTSIWDFGIGYFYFRAYHTYVRVMIKEHSFRFPQKYILRGMGGFPVNRENPTQIVHSVVSAMNELPPLKPGEKLTKKNMFHLVICPEGTRTPVHKWKTGYHTIARATGVPVYLSYYDYKTKRGGVLPDPIPLTDDARADTDRIQAIYESLNLTPLHEGMYVTK